MIYVHIQGIPATVQVDHAAYTTPDPTTWASDWDYYGGWEMSYTICDRKGRPAPWLAKKARAADILTIEEAIIESLGESA